MSENLKASGVIVARGGVDVVRDVSLTVEPGELVAVIGANGAGKSTLLRTLAGLIAPRAGDVTWAGRRLAEMDRRSVARTIAFLPQDRIVHWNLTVRRVVALGRAPHRAFAAGENDHDREAVEKAMRAMDVRQFAERPIATLSGGERARVLMARALAQEARVIIADEPSAGLDPAHTLSVYDEFRRISSSGRAVVTALHDLSIAMRYATRIVLLDVGECIAIGPPAHVLSSDNLARAFNIDALVTQVGDIPVILPRRPLT